MVVRSEDVNLKSAQFQDYKSVAKRWFAQDHYMNPGPIQFNYSPDQDRDIADSLKLSYQEVDDLTAEISGLCHSI